MATKAKPTMRKFQNIKKIPTRDGREVGVSMVVFGRTVYKDGIASFTQEFYEQNKAEFDMLEENGSFLAVDLDAKEKPFVMERSFDILAQEDEPDTDNIFVQQKNSSVLSNANPAPAKPKTGKTESGLDEEIEVSEAKITKKAADRVKANKKNKKVVNMDEEDIPATDIDDSVVSLQDKERIIDDGFEGTERKTSAISDSNWYEAVKVIKTMKDITELDIIIKNDTRAVVVSEAKKRREALLTRN